MKKFNLIIALSFFLLTFSCTGNKKKANTPSVLNTISQKHQESAGLQAPTGTILDTAYFDDKIAIDTIRYLKSPPKITALPFGYNFDKGGINGVYAHNLELVYEHNYYLPNQKNMRKPKENYVYKLPPILKLTYNSISSLDTNKCNDGKPFANYLKLKTYRYRLPDIYGYQCYFGGEDMAGHKYSQSIKENCDWCIINDWVGYIILYNPITKEAHAIAVSFDTYTEASHERYFYIDKNYTIHLVEEMHDEDDNLTDPEKLSIAARYLVKIDKNANLNVSMIK